MVVTLSTPATDVHMLTLFFDTKPGQQRKPIDSDAPRRRQSHTGHNNEFERMGDSVRLCESSLCYVPQHVRC